MVGKLLDWAALERHIERGLGGFLIREAEERRSRSCRHVGIVPDAEGD